MAKAQNLWDVSINMNSSIDRTNELVAKGSLKIIDDNAAS